MSGENYCRKAVVLLLFPKETVNNGEYGEYRMKNTTLCYIEKDGKYLMLLRNKKEADENKNKWIYRKFKFIFEYMDTSEISGKPILNVSIKEKLSKYYYRKVTFVSDQWGTEYMYLFTATGFEGELVECPEGELKWIDKDRITSLNIWEGDRAFLELLANDSPFFTMKLLYKGDDLVDINTRVYD